ncbi:hypothetical protein RRG08_045648, partial [Elysia crispata]
MALVSKLCSQLSEIEPPKAIANCLLLFLALPGWLARLSAPLPFGLCWGSGNTKGTITACDHGLPQDIRIIFVAKKLQGGKKMLPPVGEEESGEIYTLIILQQGGREREEESGEIYTLIILQQGGREREEETGEIYTLIILQQGGRDREEDSGEIYTLIILQQGGREREEKSGEIYTLIILHQGGREREEESGEIYTLIILQPGGREREEESGEIYTLIILQQAGRERRVGARYRRRLTRARPEHNPHGDETEKVSSIVRSNWTIYPLPSESSRNRLIPRISDVMCFDTQPATVRVYCRVTAELDLDPFWNLPR